MLNVKDTERGELSKSDIEIDSLFPLSESDLHEFGEIGFLFARHHQHKHSFVGVFLGNQCLLHHRLSVRILGFRLPKIIARGFVFPPRRNSQAKETPPFLRDAQSRRTGKAIR